MNQTGILLGLAAGVILTCAVLGLGYAAWSVSIAWTDEGTVNWVGQKHFESPSYGVQGWYTAFSVQTQNHGTMNFTSAPQSANASVCSNNVEYLTTGTPRVGDLVGIQNNNCGGLTVIPDP